jgi:hypothetical protein
VALPLDELGLAILRDAQSLGHAEAAHRIRARGLPATAAERVGSVIRTG